MIPSAVVNDAALITQFGRDTVDRGRAYARAGRVQLAVVDGGLIQARVRGSAAQAYVVVVQLSDDPYGHQGSCTCPLGAFCKHVAATLLSWRERNRAEHRASSGASPRVDLRPDWERDLSGLVSRPTPSLPTIPLGLRIEGAASPAGAYLRCRPVMRSQSTGKWVQTGASWGDVSYAYHRFPEQQVKLLNRMRQSVEAASGGIYGGYGGYYRSPPGGWLDLAGADEGLWFLLRRLIDHGLRLVGAKDSDTVSLADDPLRLEIDHQAQPDGGLVVQPRLLAGEAVVDAATPVPIGDPVHGFALLRPGPSGRGGRIELVGLSDPVAPGLARWVVADRAVTVPPADRARFLAEYLPLLRSQTAVVSADGSVELPTPYAPDLRLLVHHSGPEQVELHWTVGYGPAEGGGAEFDLDDPGAGAGVRDPAAERDLWARLDEVLGQAPEAVVNRLQPDRPRGRAVLTGLAAAEFVAQQLPGLAARGVEVRQSGEQVDYRRADGAPTVTVSTEETDGRSDWFDLSVSVTVAGEPVPFVLLFRALADGDDHLILPSGLYFSLDQPEFAQLIELIDEARALQDRERSGLRIHVQQADLWAELTRLGVIGRQAERWSSRVAELAGLESPDEVAVPDGLLAELRPYQHAGYAWLHQLWRLGLGGILADDMGLGKTLQALALIAKVRESAGPQDPPFLVVAPTSVVGNWIAEVGRFTPGLRVVEVQQTDRKRGRPLTEDIDGADIVVTSYTLLRLDEEAYRGVAWSGLILDEAQFVKNHQAKTYAAIRRMGVAFTIAMTGTPLENSLMDLWSMLSLTAQGMFPNPSRFREFYQRPIERGQHPERLSRLRERIRPVMLRRTKSEVAKDLPEKQEQVLEVDLHPRHARIYQRQLQRERQKILGLLGDLDANRFTILRSLTVLRQLSLDAALVDTEHEGVPSAKVDLLIEMLTELTAEGHRALVFSQFTTFLRRVGERLTAAGLDHHYLDGQTRNRSRVIEGFKTGSSGVFLISLKAGGFGLNLTEADYCFVLDPWWNPASEAQAIDRTHRIGQTRAVMVYRMVSRDTIEGKVMELKSRKQQLFDTVMSADGFPAAALSAEEIHALLAG